MPERRFLDEPYLSQRLILARVRELLHGLARDTTLPARVRDGCAVAVLRLAKLERALAREARRLAP